MKKLVFSFMVIVITSPILAIASCNYNTDNQRFNCAGVTLSTGGIVSTHSSGEIIYYDVIMENTGSFNFSVISATPQECVVVGSLMWEVKTDGGLRDKNSTYTWFDPSLSEHPSSGLNIRGIENGGVCNGSSCDTYHYVQEVNSQGLCTYNDWRMPTKEELLELVEVNELFPQTVSGGYWTDNHNESESAGEYTVNILTGSTGFASKENLVPVRLVRIR